ncbi:site-specific integrase [Streptococcus pyogenes]|nr:site-specific integrase [Streptococcus pyogenes]
MGYKSIATTMDTYAELAPQRKLEAVDIYLDKLAEITQYLLYLSLYPF